jgi:hypothetical protein
MFSENLSNLLRTQVQKRCRFRQFAELPEQSASSAKGRGDTFAWNIFADLPAPAAADHEFSQTNLGELDEGIAAASAIPTTRLAISQGTCTVLEFGHAVPYSGMLDDMSAQPVREIIKKALERNAAQTLDAVAHKQFQSTLLTVQPSSGSSATAIDITENGTAAANTTVAMRAAHVRAISVQMRERNMPTFAHGDYYCVARPLTLSSVEKDLEAIQQYTDSGFGRLTNGEKGRYAGVRFVEQTNIADQAWTDPDSDEAFFFGEDAVNECCVVPEEIRGKIPDDYGRGKGIAWYYIGNFALTRPAVAASVSDARIMHWATAA